MVVVWARVVLPEKLSWLCGPKPLPYLWPKCAIFATLFMAFPKIRYPIYDRYEERAFGDDLIDNDEKVASSNKHVIRHWSAKTIPHLRLKRPNLMFYLWRKRLKDPTLWGRTYLYNPHILVMQGFRVVYRGISHYIPLIICIFLCTHEP